MTSLAPALLEQLLGELSTLASVYHKPPSTFVGHGRYGADAIQHAAIQEQRQNAVDNPIAAAAMTTGAASSNGAAAVANNAENLLDIDFDGAAPSAGLEGSLSLGTSPVIGGTGAAAKPGSAMGDMLSLFDSNGAMGPGGGLTQGQEDLMGGFGGLDLGGGSGGASASASGSGNQGQKKTNEDLLGMF